MLNPAILNTETQEFIRNYSGSISKLAFAGSPFKNVSVRELIQQIEGRKKCEKKLSLWFETSKIYYPPKLNLEQTSSEITAKYKASLVEGNSLADITGGFGIDSFYFSANFENVFHYEINKELSEIAELNFSVLGAGNIECSSEDGLQKALSEKYDVIYADPSRRHEAKGKVFFLQDCQPNIPENVEKLLENCNILMLKTSPMLDISVGLSELKHIFEIHIIAVENEVRELLWLLKKNSSAAPNIKTVNFSKLEKETFNFTWNEKGFAEFSMPEKYLYEPNAAIMKSGAFDLVSQKFKLKKLHNNTHLYTNDKLIDFPGRTFTIEKTVPYSKKEMRQALSFKKANVATRNFPESVETLRKKWKIKDGGEIYLFFVTNIDTEKIMLVCKKVENKKIPKTGISM